MARDKYMMQSGQQTDEAQSYYPPNSGLPHFLGKAEGSDDNAPAIDDVTDRGLSGDSLAETAPTEPWMIH